MIRYLAVALVLVAIHARAALVASAIDGDTFYNVAQPRYDLYGDRADCPEGAHRAEYVRPMAAPTIGCWTVQGNLVVLNFGNDVIVNVESTQFHHVFHRAT